jgi:transcriptional regulator with XRE-family HTH domain
MKKPLKLGTQLLIARRDMEVTLNEVSEDTGIMPHTISSIEKNKGNPKLETILKLAEFYGYELRIM